GLDLIDLVVGLDQELLRVRRVDDIIARVAANKALTELDHFVLTLVNGLDPDAVGGAAIFLADDHVLSHIHKFAGHIAGISRFKGSIGKTFAGAVRRDEVLEDGKAFAKVRENWFLNDIA